MRAEFAKLRRERREMREAIEEMTEAALQLADYVTASAPSRPVTDDELTKVEDGVVAIVLDQTRERMKVDGASEFRLAYLDGEGAAYFRDTFRRRFRKQAALATADHGGHA